MSPSRPVRRRGRTGIRLPVRFVAYSDPDDRARSTGGSRTLRVAMPRLPVRSIAAALLVVLAAASGAWAQRFRLMEGPGVPPRFPPSNFEDGRFTACKLMYTSVRREQGGVGWATDYPFAAINLMTRLSELTRIRISRDAQQDVNYWVIRLTDDTLYDCPFLLASDVGTLDFSDDEVKRLRAYLLKGGFLWVDDFWGTPAWEQWALEIRRVLPEFPIMDVPDGDPIREVLFSLPHQIEQVSNIGYWRATGTTTERGDDSPHADFREIADRHGRILVVMTHNTDIGDSMEREAESPDYFAEFSPNGYALATNIVLYALTH
jgi:hypothetical protein